MRHQRAQSLLASGISLQNIGNHSLEGSDANLEFSNTLAEVSFRNKRLHFRIRTFWLSGSDKLAEKTPLRASLCWSEIKSGTAVKIRRADSLSSAEGERLHSNKAAISCDHFSTQTRPGLTQKPGTVNPANKAIKWINQFPKTHLLWAYQSWQFQQWHHTTCV